MTTAIIFAAGFATGILITFALIVAALGRDVKARQSKADEMHQETLVALESRNEAEAALVSSIDELARTIRAK